jgi:RimJ/RimL family protein N-acetyltransferase
VELSRRKQAPVELPLEHCAIRSWRITDIPQLAHHANNREVWRNLRDRFPHPFTVTDAARWVRTASAARPETHFAIAVDGEVVGGIGLELQTDVHARSAEIGYWLGRSHWGRGLATEAVRGLTLYGFAAFGLCRIFACVFEWNPASRRVLEKAGYTLEGRLRKAVVKDGELLDSYLYAIVQEDGVGLPRAD